jgi:Chaperone for flagella basal body P-ring formation
MSSRRILFGALLVASAIAPVAVGRAQAPAAAPQAVEILLQAEARADGPLVRIGNVAQLDCGDARLREAMACLDLAEFQGSNDRVVLSRDELHFRLLLAGQDPKSFRLVGAKQCLVRKCTGAVTEEAILEAARKAVLDRIPQFAKNVTIKLACPVAPPALEYRPKDTVCVQAEFVEGQVPLGKTMVVVDVIVNGYRRALIPTLLEVMPGSPSAPATLKQSLLRSSPPAADEDPVLVKVRDRIKIVARVGETRFIATGEAMQEGRAGQSIRVRNVDSDRTVMGRVVAAGMIEVDY